MMGRSSSICTVLLVLVAAQAVAGKFMWTKQELIKDAGITTDSEGLTPSPSSVSSPQRTRVFPFTCAPKRHFKETIEKLDKDIVLASYFVTGKRDELFYISGSNTTLIPGIQEFHYLHKINTTTMTEVWRVSLDLSLTDPEWHLGNTLVYTKQRNILVQHATVFSKFDSQTGKLLKRGRLPVPDGHPRKDTGYRGEIILSDGNIVTRSLMRQAGCQFNSLIASGLCPFFPTAQVPNYIVLVDGKNLKTLDKHPEYDYFPTFIASGVFDGVEYVFAVETGGFLKRYIYKDRKLTLDEEWSNRALTNPDLVGKGISSAPVLLHDWLVMTSSSNISPYPLNMTAVKVSDPTVGFSITPFGDVPLPPIEVVPPFSLPGPDPATWLQHHVTVDPVTNLVIVHDYIPGKIAAYKLTDKGFKRKWIVNQYTNANTLMIGTPDNRIYVATNTTDIVGRPTFYNLGLFLKENLIFRSAETGNIILRTQDLGRIGLNSHSPGFPGEYWYLPRTIGVDSIIKVKFPVKKGCAAAMNYYLGASKP